MFNAFKVMVETIKHPRCGKRMIKEKQENILPNTVGMIQNEME